MTINEFYDEIGENFEEMLNRFASPERIAKYVRMFAADESFPTLRTALDAKDYDLAFRMVHTLKGVSANLGFMKLFNKSVVLTEILRAKEYDKDLETPYEDIKTEYEAIITRIGQIN